MNVRSVDLPRRALRAAVFILIVITAFYIGQRRIHIETDITAALPKNDPVVAAADRILGRHPAMDNVFIDINAQGEAGREVLVQAADFVGSRLAETGLVDLLVEEKAAEVMPAALKLVINGLPLFFNESELQDIVAPRLAPDRLKGLLAAQVDQLLDIGGIGQATLIAQDPLMLREIVLGRLGRAMSFGQATFYQGHVFSQDYQHVLIMAAPRGKTGDSAYAGRLDEALSAIERDVEKRFTSAAVNMVYTGTFRAALDNERIIRADAQRAVLLVTVGLAVLILLAFRRPWIGLLAAVPAVCGAMLAALAYSLFQDAIMAVALGFGGALISITVDHGLAYVLLLDQPAPTRGREVSKTAWSVTSFTVYTTAAALLSLLFSGVPMFEQVGLFAALGVILAAASVHVFFPLVFPSLGPASRKRWIPLDRVLDRISKVASPAPVHAAVLCAVVLAFFIRFDFSGDLTTMNTMRPETRQAEEMIQETWGAMTSGAYLMLEAPGMDALLAKAEKVDQALREAADQGVLTGGGLKAGWLPGPQQQAANLSAWRRFWTEDRRRRLAASLAEAGEAMGFSSGAFAPFLETVRRPPRELKLPPALAEPLGVAPAKGGGFLLLDRIQPGPDYVPEAFFRKTRMLGASLFDPAYFSAHLAGTLNRAFARMLGLLISASFVLLFFLFVDAALLFLALAPLIFSLVASLGVLGLLGRPLSIPVLMLAPVVFGLGMDYGLYMVRSRQRFGDEDPASQRAFKSAVILGGASTLLGMGSLALSDHQILRDAGTSTFLGVGFALIGALAIVPPILNRLFAPQPWETVDAPAGSPAHQQAARRRYGHLEPTPRLSARIKMRVDPMFPRLADFIRPHWRIVDLGCGYGIPAVWLATLRDGLTFFGLEPDPGRARIARRALAERAEIHVGRAQDLKDHAVDPADAALFLDAAHYLSDAELAEALTALQARLEPGAPLVLRVTIPGGDRLTFMRRVEVLKMKRRGLRPHFRTTAEMTEILEQRGFRVELVEPTAPGREETWFIARA